MPHTPHTKRLEEGGGMQHFRDALAAVLAEYVEFPPGAFVTVLDAKVTRDTTQSKGVISVLPTEMEEVVMERLEEYSHDIKDGLAKKLRLRRIPHIFWELDRTEAVAEDVERALHELKKKGDL